jgi:hypothetical protein
MKRTIILFCLLLPAAWVWAQQIHTAEYFELATPIPSTESHEYQASNYVKLLPGFQSRPEIGSYVQMKIEKTLERTEWYYEILNDDGTITYQHLEYASDTTVNHKDVKIIIRTNTLYDKGEHAEVTREYIYEGGGKVYWWNKGLQEFTVLYDFGAEEGDEWEITVGTDSIVTHVDAVEEYEFEGNPIKVLHVSDADDVFSGTIFCGIGHMTSFFPERLMQKGIGYRVVGIRCYWRNGELVFKYGDRDCDEVYQEYHNDIEEDGPSTGSGALTVYPNPTHNVLVVETCHGVSLPTQTYRITNLMGQTLMTGTITAETQQIDVSNLPQGMYFITVEGETRKFVVR